MYKVGLTGGIGSGKSTVAELLRDRGIAVYDSDSRAKMLMVNDESLRAALANAFGAECYTEEGLNRAWLAERVFTSAEELAWSHMLMLLWRSWLLRGCVSSAL